MLWVSYCESLVQVNWALILINGSFFSNIYLHFKRKPAKSFSCLLKHFQFTVGVPSCEITEFNTAYLAVHLHVGNHNIPRALVGKNVLNKYLVFLSFLFFRLTQVLLQIGKLSHMTSYTLAYGYRRFWTICFHTTSGQSIKTNSFRYVHTISFLVDSFHLQRIKFKERGSKQTFLWYVI